jgi:hypothetical protein
MRIRGRLTADADATSIARCERTVAARRWPWRPGPAWRPGCAPTPRPSCCRPGGSGWRWCAGSSTSARSSPLGADEAELRLHWAGNLPAVQGRIDGRPALLAMDTGDRSASTLFAPFAEAHGLRGDAGTQQVTGWGVGGPLLARLLRLPRLELGTVALREVLARVPVGPMGVFSGRLADASVGSAVLGRLRPTFDYGRGVVRLAAAGSPGPVGLADRTGMWLRRPDPWQGDFEVHSLRRGGAAERARLRAGDRVVAVDGTPCRALVLASWREQAAAAPAGTLLRVRLQAEPADRLLSLDAAP